MPFTLIIVGKLAIVEATIGCLHLRLSDFLLSACRRIGFEALGGETKIAARRCASAKPFGKRFQRLGKLCVGRFAHEFPPGAVWEVGETPLPGGAAVCTGDTDGGKSSRSRWAICLRISVPQR